MKKEMMDRIGILETRQKELIEERKEDNKLYIFVNEKLDDINLTQSKMQGQMTLFDSHHTELKNEITILRKRFEKHTEQYLAHEGRKATKD